MDLTFTISAERGLRSAVSESRKVAVPLAVNPPPPERGKRMMELARKFWNDESGQGLAEYALLLGLIVIGVVVLIQGMGVSIKKLFGQANIDLEKAATT
jgi:pilus assembly protein Flp/PilA